MSAPYFSIIVCCWNSIAHIRACVASIQAQTDQDLEIVFVDGGSTDGTLEFIESVNAPKKILRDVRGGIANAMNQGIQAASGTVLAHLHSDDYYIEPQVLSKVRAAFDAHPGTMWLYGRFKNDNNGAVVPPDYPFLPYSRSTLLRRNIVPHVSTFTKKAVFNDLGAFDERYKLAMDYEFWLRISGKYEPVQLDGYLGVFRRHEGSATTKHKLRSFNEDFKARFTHGPLWRWPEFAARYVYRRLREV